MDWSEAEQRARMFDHLAEVIEAMKGKTYVPVRLDRLAVNLHFDVQTFSDGHGTMEFTLLEPQTGKVRITDNSYFPEPTECILIGSEDDLEGNGAMNPGVVKYNAKLVIEVGGQRVKEHGSELRAMRLTLHLPGRKSFSPWTD